MKRIHTDNAPKAVGHYSQAVVSNGFVFCSGQLGVNTQTGKLIDETITEQSHQAIKNLQAVLEAANSSLDKVVKITCYLKNISDYQAFNEVYATYFTKSKPARATIEVANLPLNALVEIDAIAQTPSKV